MAHRKSERLELIAVFHPDHDALIRQTSENEKFGRSDCDLYCGQDGKLVLRNFSKEEAQHYFRMERVRVVIQCPTCGSYNLLAAAVEKCKDGSVVTLPGRE